MGLAAACELIKNGYQVIIIESSGSLGGLAKVKKLGDFEIEKYYHFVYWSDEKNISDFFDENRIVPQIRWRSVKNALWSGGQLHSIDNPVSILLSNFFTLRDKIDFIKAFLKLTFKKTGDGEGMLAIDWLKKTFSPRLYDILWDPLLDMKFQNDKYSLSADWIVTRLNQHMASKHSFNFGPTFGFITNTYKYLFESIDAKLRRNGEVWLENPVKEIIYQDSRIVGIKTAKKNFEVGVDEPVFSYIPLPNLLAVAANFPDSAKKRLGLYKMVDVVCLAFFAKRSLSPYFWINVGDKNIPFTVIIEFSHLSGTERFGGRHLVYLSRYLERDKERLWQLSDEEITEEFLKHLKKIFPDLRSNEIEASSLHRSVGAAPSFFKDYKNNMPPKNFKEISNLYIGSASHIYPLDRGTGNSIKIGKDLVDFFIEQRKKQL